MTKRPKFQFYEKVSINAYPGQSPETLGKAGYIFGLSEDTDGNRVYTVSIEDTGVCWCVAEEHLSSLGQILNRDDFYGK